MSWIASTLSRPRGAQTRTILDGSLTPRELLGAADESRHAGEHAHELGELVAHRQTATVEAELANRVLVSAAPLLHHGDRLADPAVRLEIAQEHDRVRDVADIDRCLRRTGQAVLGHHHD